MDELDAISTFISRDSPAAGANLTDSIFESVSRLALFPNLGRVVPEVRELELRELIVGRYRVLYRVVDDGAEILSVQHGSRRIDLNPLL